ncbi:MAG: CDP-alcohol phosphatidyltransferase family protein [Patescibacteria group bacterium]|jgi:CDP-diacylglycerol--glycerol-3-phosphate 3-phosphatidyltransferase
MSEKMTLANKMTISRMTFFPAILFFIIYFWPGNKIAMPIALCLMIISEIIDILDGYVARKYNQVSKMGKLLDPLSDAFWHGTVYYCLIQLELANPWLLFLMISREIAVVCIRYKSLITGIVLSARIIGKIKCHVLAWNSCLIVFFYIFKINNVFNIVPYFLHVQWLVAAVILYSLYDYYISNKKIVLSD